jgi:hypothetical protein
VTSPLGPGTRPAISMRTAPLDASASEARVIDLADPGWCWLQLRNTALGVLSTRSRRSPLDMDVAYTVVGDEILIPIPWDSEALHLLAGRDVTLSLTGRDEDSLRWVVRATGNAEFAMVPLASDTVAQCRSSHPAHGATSESTDTMVLTVDRLRGYHETPLDHLHPLSP